MRVDFWFAHRIDDFLDLFLLLISLSCLSLSGLDSMQNVIELLKDMLQAINPDDRKVCATVTFFLCPFCNNWRKCLMSCGVFF